MSSRRRILIFADYYLPSIGAGGGVRILANIVERFSDRYEFFVVARDHDSKTNRSPFSSIPLNEWTTTGSAHAFYFSRNRLSASVAEAIVTHAKPDLVFLNSLFSIGSIRYLWERRKGKFASIPVVVSPCGEILVEALKHKSVKKRAHLLAASITGLHRGLVWRATSEKEAQDIRTVIGANEDIFVIPDLAPRTISLENMPARSSKTVGSADLIFIARIVPNKNLHYLLELLQEVRSSLKLTIVGPHEDQGYWQKCTALIESLPSNISIEILGSVTHESVLGELAKAHFFVLPTESENFGYSIVEALAMGCPILISDRTPWNFLGDRAWAEILSLEDRSEWIRAIEKSAEVSQKRYDEMSNGAVAFANEWLSSSPAEAQLEQLFEYAINAS